MLKQFNEVLGQKFTPGYDDELYPEKERLRRAARKEEVKQRVEANKAKALAGEVTEVVPNKTFEVSTKGDDLGKQFSALNATFQEGPYAGRTIEDVWQKEIKKSGKGKPPSKRSILYGQSYTESKAEYEKLWSMWVEQNPEAAAKLKAKVDEGYKLVDSFAGDPNKTVNQAEALTNVLNNMGTEEVKVETVKRYSVEDLRNNPDKIYIYGDNLERIGKKNQSIIRDEPNAYGIATKKSPSMGENAFFTDDEFEANKKIIDEDIAAIKADGRTIVLPEDGLGTGLAGLKNRAPKTFAYLEEQLNALRGPEPTRIKFNQVDPNPDYVSRTMYNASNADKTYDFTKGEVGSGATKTSATDAGKYYAQVVVDDAGRMVNSKDNLAKHIAQDLLDGLTVNIAGHGAYKSTRRGSVGFTKEISQVDIDNELIEVFQKVKEIIGDQPITGKVISGGQSGFDEAGVKAANMFGIPSEVNYSGQGLYRPSWASGARDDIDNFDEFKARFDTFGSNTLGAAEAQNVQTNLNKLPKLLGGSKFSDEIIRNLPGYAIVPMEQFLESVLRMAGIKGAAKLAAYWVRYEIYVIAAALIGKGFAGGIASLTVPQTAQAMLLTGDTEGFENHIVDLEKKMETNRKEAGDKVFDFIIKASPGWWKDEWLLERYPELEGWEEMFPDLAVTKMKISDTIGKGFNKLFGDK